MNNLPRELLLNIFSFLSVNEVRQASLVNQNLSLICQHNSLWKKPLIKYIKTHQPYFKLTRRRFEAINQYQFRTLLIVSNYLSTYYKNKEKLHEKLNRLHTFNQDNAIYTPHALRFSYYPAVISYPSTNDSLQGIKSIEKKIKTLLIKQDIKKLDKKYKNCQFTENTLHALYNEETIENVIKKIP